MEKEWKMTNVIAAAEMAAPTVFPPSMRIFIPTRNSNGKPSGRRAVKRREWRDSRRSTPHHLFIPSVDIDFDRFAFVLSRRGKKKRGGKKKERTGIRKISTSAPIFSRINLILSSSFATRLLRASIQFPVHVRLPVYGYP